MGTTTMMWNAPGPGTWELDTAHFSGSVSRIVRDLMMFGMRDGFRTGMEMMGAPLAGVEAEFVNGAFYMRRTPLIGGNRDLPDPPAPLLWLVTRVHPAFRKRTKQAAHALESRVWLQEFRRWESEWKPELIAKNRAFGAVDVTALDDVALSEHLHRLYDHLLWSSSLHFRLHCSDLGPIGRLLVRGEEWGLDAKQMMSTLAGASPSTSAPSEALAAIRTARAESSDQADALLAEYLAEYGDRLTTGYDIQELTLAELPDVVEMSIADARADRNVAAGASARGSEAFDELRAKVGAEHRDEFDMLVGDARLLYGLRDENGPLTYEWPAGVLRRTVLEIGRRLDASGAIRSAAHVFDASGPEMVSLLRGRSVPSADEMAERHGERMSWVGLTPPPVLGRPVFDPPVDVLPGEMPVLMKAILMVMDLMEGSDDDAPMSGTGVGTETYRGTARVVADADEAFDRAEPGDIIVTRLTVPTFNSVLAMAGGVVTENGGLLCHTAVIARELGIPAIVGVKGALDIPDGAQIEIDPLAGTVTRIGVGDGVGLTSPATSVTGPSM